MRHHEAHKDYKIMLVKKYKSKEWIKKKQQQNSFGIKICDRNTTNVLTKSGFIYFYIFDPRKVCSCLCLQSPGKIKPNAGPCDADESNIHDSRGQAAHPG